MNRLLTLLAVAICALMPVRATATFQTPDFAYPQTVINDARQALTTAATPTERFLAVMQITKAQVALCDPDSVNAIPALIEHYAAKEQDRTYRGLLKLYRATVIKELYRDNSRHNYNAEAPLLPIPTDICQWTGEQARYALKAAVADAFADLKQAEELPLSQFSAILNLTDVPMVLYPKMCDFTYTIAGNIASGIFDSEWAQELSSELLAKTTPGTEEWAFRVVDTDVDAYALYKQYSTGLCGGLLLMNIATDMVEERELVTMIRDYLEREPSNIITEHLKNKLEVLTASDIQATFPSIIETQKPFMIKFEGKYATNITVNVFRAFTDNRYSCEEFLKTATAASLSSICKRVEYRTFTYEPDTYQICDSTAITVKEDGLYIITVNYDGIQKPAIMRILPATSYTPLIVTHGNRTTVIAVRTKDGEPMKDAVLYIDGAEMGPINEEGYIAFYNDKRIPRSTDDIRLVKDKQVYDFTDILSLSTDDTSFDTNGVSAHFFVSRPIYHPGDTVQWSVVVGKYDSPTRRSHSSPNIELEVGLYDANNKQVSTLNVVTDQYGRASGQFTIPKDRLTGTYNLKLNATNYTQLRPRTITGSFEVSEFKTPTFEIQDLKCVANATGDIVITGKACTYAGMPVVEAQVSITMKYSPTWWMYEHHDDVAASTVTGNDGTFSCTIAADKVDVYSRYYLTAAVTSKAAEMQQASIPVCIRNKQFIRQRGEMLINTDNTKVVPIYAYDALGNNIEMPVHWSITKGNRPISSGDGVITAKGLNIDLSAYPADKYDIRVEATDCEPLTTDITTYSVMRKAMPATETLIVPQTDFTVPAGKKMSILIGTSKKSVGYVVYSFSNTLNKVQRLKLAPGFNRLEVTAPEAAKTLKLTVAVLDGLDFVVKEIVIKGEDTQLVDLTVESWRNRLTPNTTETLTLRFKRADGSPASGALIATMYNKALDNLAQGTSTHFLQNKRIFSFYDYDFIAPVRAFTMSTYPNISHYNSYYNHGIYRHVKYFGTPAFKYAPEMGYPIMYRSNARLAAAPECVDEDMACYAEDAVQIFDTTDKDEEPAEPYRPAEVLQALWCNSAEINGEAVIKFTVPDCNGSWHFMATAWDEALNASGVDHIAIANKPVMITPNVPRFMRAGDSAIVPATVFNNTENNANISVLIELFDPESSKVISRETRTLAIAAGTSSVVKIDVPATEGNSSIAIRWKATGGNFTDGEVDLIPIVADELTVIDSETFYLSGNNNQYSTTIPQSSAADVTIKYCANPIWNVVKAVPGTYDTRVSSAFSAAHTLFGALTARGLNRKFPEIKQAISTWQANEADSALVSRLYADEQLKALTLQQTPWMWQAASHTADMQRLAITFDTKEINRLIDLAVNKLEELQQPDGGFKYGAWSKESSFPVTSSILNILGQLNVQGFLTGTAKLDRIINRAFQYLDNNLTGFENIYASVYSLYPGRQPQCTAGKQAISHVAQYAISTWKDVDPARRARFALYLNATGYEPVAQEIIASLRQYEVSSPQEGIYFPSVDNINAYSTILQAFATIDPVTSELDGMRQWLTLRTQVTDDLGTWEPTRLITAILCSGSRWTRLQPNAPTITINGAPATPTKSEAITGTITINANGIAGATVSVKRQPDTAAAYGSVNIVHNTSLTGVKARSSEEIAIQKRFLVNNNGTVTEATRLRAGMRVTVQLLITTARDMEYLTIIDERPAAFEPVDQLPGYVYANGIAFYRENYDSQTRLFIDFLPAGTYYITYDMTVTADGTFSSGPASIMSQYAPEINARSAASLLNIGK